MRGASNAMLTVLALAVLMISAYLLFTVPRTQVIQQAAPVGQTTEEKKEFPIWNVMVSLMDDEGYPVYDANVWLLFEQPKDIYKTPTDKIYKSATDVDQTYTFEAVMTGKTYYVLAAADGYYNAGADVEVPKEFDKDSSPSEEPIVVEITMSKKGEIIGQEVPLTYRGSSPEVAKLVYDEDTELYETEFQFVASTDGEVRFEKIRIDLNTDNLGSATVDKLVVTVGEQQFEFEDVTGAKTIEFDEEQKIAEGATLPIHISVDGTDIDGVSGELFKVTLYDVQEGEWTETVEGPA